MSDTCHLTLFVHPSDQAAVIDAVGVEPAERRDLADRPRPRCLLCFEDVHPHLSLAELAHRGITFDGSHTDGAGYPGRLFAAHGGELAAIDQPFGVVSVAVDLATLRAHDAALTCLAAYKRLRARVRADFEREPAPNVPLDALQLREVGDQEPWHRLLGSLSLAGVSCHVEALAVRNVEDLDRQQEPVGDEFRRALDLASDAFSTDGGFTTARLRGSDGQDHDYVLFVYPCDR